MNKLYVHYRKVLVGVIGHDSIEGIYSFEYDEQWIANGFEISPTMKFRTTISNGAIKSFIENLLPEGEGLEELSAYFHISKANKFAILQSIGLDTTGALTFSLSKIYDVKTVFREIQEDELAQRIAKREEQSIQIWDDKPRLSVAGVQAKLPIAIIGDKFGLGDGDICSTHILKFNKKGENVILNEFISMRLAKNLGFNVADVEYNKIGEECVLFVERFDREIINNNLVQKRHIIDSVQALGLPVSYKYERNLGINMKDIREGVSFEKLFSIMSEASVPLLFKEQIINFSMMNLILGNSDAHGKNISFFVDEKGLSVAPFYDLVNVTMYDGVYEQDMAMAIDDEFEFIGLSRYDFAEFLSIHKISSSQYFSDFKKLTQKISVALNTFDFIDDKLIDEEKAFIEEYKLNIIKRVNLISSILNSIRFTLPFEGQSDSEFLQEFSNVIKKVLSSQYIENNDSENVKAYLKKMQSKVIQKI